MGNGLRGLMLALAALSVPVHADVGRTRGTGSVSKDGVASYTIPIWSPPGVGEIKPALALTYSHTTDNGLLGVGWRIGGWSSAIARCNKTTAQDGARSAPLLATTDAFCLDGNKLRLVSGVAGTAGAVYRTEMESFARVTAFGAAGSGPAWFELRTKDGHIYEFGNGNNSRVLSVGTSTARLWALSSIRDRAGNRVDFTYHLDVSTGSYRPNEILYVTNLSAGLSTPLHSIRVLYEGRPDPLYGFVFGSAQASGMVNEPNRVARVEVRSQNALIRAYVMSYVTGAGNRSLLRTITECSTSLTSCLSPTTFSYASTPPFFGGPIPISGSYSPLFGDVNGDARDDSIRWTGAGWTYRLSNGASLDGDINVGVAVVDPNGGRGLLTDWNGDRRTDLLEIGASGNARVLVASDLGFSPGNLTAPLLFTSNYGLADVNGDGRDDLLEAPGGSSPPGGALPVVVRLRSGVDLAAPTTLGFLPDYHSAARFIEASSSRRTSRIDFNGDGRLDSFIAYEEHNGVGGSQSVGRAVVSGQGLGPRLVIQANVWLGDFNGDGLTDVATRGAVHYSRGSGVFAQATGPASNQAEYPLAAPSGITDYNGDGRDDLLIRHAPSGQLHAFYGGSPNANLATPSATSVTATSVLFVDVNGDGHDDLIDGQAVRLHSSEPVDLMVNAVDGFGEITSFLYAPLTDPTVYTKGSGSLYPLYDLVSSDRVARSMTFSDGSNTGLSRFDYKYRGAVFDLSGRGFLGFAGRTIQDTREPDLRTEETYDVRFPYHGVLLQRVVARASTGARITATNNTVSSLTWGTAQSTERHFPYTSVSTTRDYGVGGTYAGLELRNTQTTIAIDASSGAVADTTSVTTEVQGGLKTGATWTVRVQNTSFFNDETTWCLGKPLSTTETHSHSLPGGATKVRLSTAEWDAANCRISATVADPGNAQFEIRTEYGYDTFGNPNLITATPAPGQGQSARTTQIDWGSLGQHPVSATNAKSHGVSVEWDYARGLRTRFTDANAVVVSWSYDSFGRLRRQTHADSTFTEYTLNSCNGCVDGQWTVRAVMEAVDTGVGGAPIRTSRAYFDLLDRQIREERQLLGGAFSTTRRDYDKNGRILNECTPAIAGELQWCTTFSYDLLGRMLSVQRQTSEGDTSTHLTQYSYNGFAGVVTDAKGRPSTYYHNAAGQIAQTIDSAGTDTDFEYDALGNLVKSRDVNGSEVAASYDFRGKRTSSSDPNAGNWTYTYFPFGELKSQTDAKQQTLTITYDELSRPLSRVEAEGTTTFTYDSAANGKGLLASASSPGSYAESYIYDSLSRLTRTSATADGATYHVDRSYDVVTGALDSITYPTSTSGFRFRVKYNYTNGLIASIQNFTNGVLGTVYWRANTTNSAGQIVDEVVGNGLQTVSGYDRITGKLEYRTLTSSASSVPYVDASYDWDKTGNLSARTDSLQAITETFYYDSLDRLDYSTRNGVVNLDLAYNAIGNITSKSDVGTYTYHPTKKHAVISTAGAQNNSYSYDDNGNMLTRNGAATTWYSYNLPKRIANSTYSSTFSYGPNRDRWKQVATSSSGTETITYIGKLFEKRVAGSTTEYRHYVYGPTGTVSLYKRSTSSEYMYYFVKDHEGSLQLVTCCTAQSVQGRMSFSAFGKRRGNAWNGNPTSTDLSNIAATTRRGFTGHEHLDNLGVIHMNGRVFDPSIARFMSADPFIQSPYFSQSYNRYSYALNNPLTHTDPSGLALVGQCLSWCGPDSLRIVRIPPPRTIDALIDISEPRAGREWGGPPLLVPSPTTNPPSADPGTNPVSPNPPPVDSTPSPVPPGASPDPPPSRHGPAANWVHHGADTMDVSTRRSAQTDAVSSKSWAQYTEDTNRHIAELQWLLAIGDGTTPTAPSTYYEDLTNEWFPIVGCIRSGCSAGRWAVAGFELWPGGKVTKIGRKWVARDIADVACENGCDAVAKQIHGHIGGKIVTIRPTDPHESVRLGSFRGKDWRWAYHAVVVKDGRVYDITTGHEGLSIEDYKKLWRYADGIDFGF